MNLLPAPVAPGDAPAGAGLVNAEAVEIELRPARLPSRALALLVDCLLLIMPGFLLFGLVQLVFAGFDQALGSAAATVATVLLAVGYPVLVETCWDGRSLGKRVLGLRVIREDGRPLRARHAFTRALVGLAVEFPGLLLLFVCWPAGIITMLASAHGRRLGDLVAGTMVVHERSVAPWRVIPAVPHQVAAWAATLDLAAVDDGLAMELRQFTTRAGELREPYRAHLLEQLAGEVVARISPPPPAGLPPWLLLVTVLAERRRRRQAQLVVGRSLTFQVLPTFGPRDNRGNGPQLPALS
ncbi:MAG TPA: RDD family protein [Actinoplanes sp.]|nr:RDD family protein [Actinoplanes sp.]